MGCVKSRPLSLPLDDGAEDHNSCHTETTKSCCWTGTRKLFSNGKRSKLMAMHVFEDDIDNHGDDDVDFTIVNDSSKSSSATTIEPMALHRSWSAPALLGQECEEASVPALRSMVENQLPSTSYPKDVRVSSQCFLLYHRFVNDEESGEESVSSDVEYGDENNDDDADVESNADDDTTSVFGLVYSDVEYTDNECSVDQEEEINDPMVESTENETSSESDQKVVVKRYDPDQMIKVKIINKTDTSIFLSSGPSEGNDVTSEDGEMSQDDDGWIDEIEVMFVVSLIWTFMRNAFYGVYQAGHQFVHDIMKEEKEKEEEEEDKDGMDIEVEGEVVVFGETGDRSHSGHRERYSYFPSNFWAFIRNAYNAGLQFVHDIVVGRKEGETDVDQGWTMVGTEETGDCTPSGRPWRYSDFAANYWAFIHDIKSGVSQFFYDIVKEVEGVVIGTVEAGDLTPHQDHPESDFESDDEPDVDTDIETDPDQPSTSYKRDKNATFDFAALRFLLDSDEDDDDEW